VKSVDKIEGSYVTITQNNGEKMVLKKIPANQSIYHNMEYKNGTGPTDKTTIEMRTKVGDLSFGKFLQENFDKLQTLATRMKKENFSYEELQNIREKGIDNYGK